MTQLAGDAFFGCVDGVWHVVQAPYGPANGYALCGITPDPKTDHWSTTTLGLSSKVTACTACYLIAGDLDLLK